MYNKEQREKIEALNQRMFLSPLKYTNFWGAKRKTGNPIGKKKQAKELNRSFGGKKDFNCAMNM